MPSEARVCVSSSRTRRSPAFTREPSFTRISRIMPPCWCWIFLLLPSTTTMPRAITAPDNLAKLPQTKIASTIKAERIRPMRIGRRISTASERSGGGGASSGRRALSRNRIEAVIAELLDLAGDGPHRTQHLLQDLVFRAESRELPGVDNGDEIDGVERARPMCDDDHD